MSLHTEYRDAAEKRIAELEEQLYTARTDFDIAHQEYVEEAVAHGATREKYERTLEQLEAAHEEIEERKLEAASAWKYATRLQEQFEALRKAAENAVDNPGRDSLTALFDALVSNPAKEPERAAPGYGRMFPGYDASSPASEATDAVS